MQTQNTTPTLVKPSRRYFLQWGTALMGILLLPLRVLAEWNKPAFAATAMPLALQALGINNPSKTTQIDIIAPEKAENGAVVQIELHSHLPNTESLMLFADKNPTMFIAQYEFAHGALPYVVTRVKLAETCQIHAIAKQGNQHWIASKAIEVLENGCG